MSHTALRRVAVRLLHDHDLARRLHEDPSRALDGVALSPEEVAWLLAVPAAAWRTDPDRSRRVLAALYDEFPASFALAPARGEGFFRSAHFHAAVQDRGSLALAFGTHMIEDADGDVAAVAHLETETAIVRRAPLPVAPSPAGELRLTPAARVVRVARGGAGLLAAVRADQPRPRLQSGHETLLVLRVPGTLEVTMEPVSDPMAELLDQAITVQPRARLENVVRSLGDHADDPATVIDGLVADGILV
jgi:hypothetical protein